MTGAAPEGLRAGGLKRLIVRDSLSWVLVCAAAPFCATGCPEDEGEAFVPPAIINETSVTTERPTRHSERLAFCFLLVPMREDYSSRAYQDDWPRVPIWDSADPVPQRTGMKEMRGHQWSASPRPCSSVGIGSERRRASGTTPLASSMTIEIDEE